MIRKIRSIGVVCLLFASMTLFCRCVPADSSGSGGNNSPSPLDAVVALMSFVGDFVRQIASAFLF